eukprot:12025901-Alexandrium_andersonii.AAC.1
MSGSWLCLGEDHGGVAELWLGHRGGFVSLPASVGMAFTCRARALAFGKHHGAEWVGLWRCAGRFTEASA